MQQIAKEYKEEERTLFQREEGSGRLRRSTTEENEMIAREMYFSIMMEEDCYLSCLEIVGGPLFA